MEVVTSSNIRRHAYLPPSALNSIDSVRVKGLWKNWLGSKTVMDDAFEKFRYHHDGYKKRRPEFAHLIGHPRRYLDEKREWQTMENTEKAPFISKALWYLYYEAEAWKIISENAKPRQKSKARKKTSEKRYCGNSGAMDLFCDEFCERYYKDHPNDEMLIRDVIDIAEDKWCCLTNAERYEYVKKNKERRMEHVEVYKSLLSDEVYKDLYLFFDCF